MSTPEQIAHYQLLELVGRDGQAENYRARDLRLQRTVAVKLLRDGTASPEAVERFRREAHIASLVTHPHVAAVHDSGDDQGRAFMVSELLEGQLLANLIDHAPLPIDRVVDIALQLTGALLAAHRCGLVHGSVSPDSVFITSDGHVKVLGLGTAVVDPAVAAGTSAFKTTAVDVETLAAAPVTHTVHPYLAPEQVAGHPASQASDLFAVGAVLYEMLTGQQAFNGETPAELARAILQQPVPPPRSRTRKVPAILLPVLQRALAKDPHERYRSAQDLSDDLRHVRKLVDQQAGRVWRWSGRRSRPLIAVGVVAVLLVAGVVATSWWWGGGRRGGGAIARSTVMISQIANGTADPDFDGTLRQAVTVYLGQSPYLDLVSDERMATVLQQMGRPAGVPLTHAVAAELCERAGSQALLEGSVSALGGSTVIALVATDCGTRATIAREQAEVQRKEDVLRVLGELTATIRTALGESRKSLATHNVRIEDATTSSLEALKAYTEAASRRASGNETEGIRWLERAIKVDPQFALAYTTLSTAYGGLGESGRSEQYARLAYALRDRVSERERLFITSQYHDRVTGDQLKAREAMEVWKRTYPRDYRPANALAVLLNRFGDFEGAAAEAEEAMRRNRAHAFPHSNLAHARRGQGRYAEARRVAEQAFAQHLETVPMRRLVYQVAEIEGDRAAARQQIDWAGSRPRGFDLTGARAQVAAFGGRLTA
ncbi:MAG: protein kinase, partial [Acidobacteria bacterium]|nr:protein kinase [Acidobacteriota bacterium]